MTKGAHTMFYTSQAEALRAFLRDKFEMLGTDVGGGWLIFDLPEAEMGCHPLENAVGPDGNPPHSGQPSISFYCDDIHATVAQLRERGVEFVDAISDVGYGLATHFKMPGEFTLELYQPRYQRKRKG